MGPKYDQQLIESRILYSKQNVTSIPVDLAEEGVAFVSPNKRGVASESDSLDRGVATVPNFWGRCGP